MRNIAILERENNNRWSISKIAIGLNDYLNGKGYSSRIYSYTGDTGTPNYVFSNRADASIHRMLFRLTGKDGSFSHFTTRKLLMKFKADNVDTIYILMLHSFYVNETMLFNHIKKHGISVVYVMLDEYAFSGKCHFKFMRIRK